MVLKKLKQKNKKNLKHPMPVDYIVWKDFFFFLRHFIFKKTLFEKLQYLKQEKERGK